MDRRGFIEMEAFNTSLPNVEDLRLRATTLAADIPVFVTFLPWKAYPVEVLLYYLFIEHSEQKLHLGVHV